jgi:hypothetical protein
MTCINLPKKVKNLEIKTRVIAWTEDTSLSEVEGLMV